MLTIKIYSPCTSLKKVPPPIKISPNLPGGERWGGKRRGGKRRGGKRMWLNITTQNTQQTKALLTNNDSTTVGVQQLHTTTTDSGGSVLTLATISTSQQKTSVN